jgi:integrase
MLVLSGCRLNEIAQIEWSEVNLEQGVITIPAERMKAGRAFVRPITKRMAEIIQSRFQTSKYVFNSDQEPNTPSKSSPRTVLVWACKHAGVPVVRPHDLRRSFITVAYGLGLQSVHTAMVVGHSIGGGAHGGYIMRDDEKLKEVAQMIEDAILAP